MGHQGGNQRSSAWSDVEARLEQAKIFSGSVSLETIGGSGGRPHYLQVQSDGAKYLLTLGEDDGKDYHVRSYFNQGSEPG
jgi:hypothetical protein